MIICLDLGATEIKVALAKNVGSVALQSEVQKIPTNAHLGKQGILYGLNRAVEMFLSADVKGVAIASAGDIDSQSKTITYATENLPDMSGFCFEEFFQTRFGLPCTVLNDAHAALLGELAFGAAKKFSHQRVAMLTLGSGVGGAYCDNGQLVANPQNDFARFGHICLHQNGRQCTCGKIGCAEMYLSGRALHKDAKTLGVEENTLFSLYQRGVQQNVGIVNNFRTDVKLLLDKIFAINNFDVCVIGGGVTDWMSQSFCSVFDGLGYKIVKAELGNTAGVFGALEFYNRSLK